MNPKQRLRVRRAKSAHSVLSRAGFVPVLWETKDGHRWVEMDQDGAQPFLATDSDLDEGARLAPRELTKYAGQLKRGARK